MGMYDTIEGEQIKCFSCDLNNYKIGDKVPCLDFNYKENLIIMPFHSDLDNYLNDCKLIIIKENKVFKLKSVRDLNKSDFNLNVEVISFKGTKTKIKTLEDFFVFLQDFAMIKIKDNINFLKNMCLNIDGYESFTNKWIISK